jgi:hypothetical protein
MRSIEPIAFTTTDGKERYFLLKMSGVKKLKDRFKVKQIAGILDRDVEECGVPILYEALLDKDGLTEEQFADLVPAYLELMGETIARLLGASMPEKKAEDPPRPTPLVQ